jgi:RNA polymerase sigma factor (sigma-70 family)
MGKRSPRRARRHDRGGERVSRGSSFASAYDDHVWQVYGYFAYRLRSRDDAEDLTQLTFERALKAWDRFDARRASLGTWLLAIAGNVLVDHYRRDRSNRHQPFVIDDEEISAAIGYREPEANRLGVSPDLAAGLERLGNREREVIALRFGGDLTGPEIAELTGLSVANVQQLLSRSLRRLRAELEAAPPADGRVRV